MARQYLQGLAIISLLLLTIEPAWAQQLSSSGIMNDALLRFEGAASTWAGVITNAATWLFWTLVVISMIFTFGFMALRKADIGEFFAEFLRFIIFTGIFWWLLTNAVTGMNIAGTIISSLPQLGAQAGKIASTKLGPSQVVDIGFELYNRTVQATSDLGWRQMGAAIVMELMALGILLVLALIAINLLLLLAASWIVLYAGVFFLGFGGSRWTSDIAINYYKTVLGIAAQLFAMVLIIAIGKQFLMHYYGQISNNMAAQELAVMLVIAVILLALVNRLPSQIAGIITGASIGGMGIGTLGAGAAMSAAGMAAAAVTTAGAAIAAGTTAAAGGTQALKAAFSKASEHVAAGTDLLSSFGGRTSGAAGGGGGGYSSTGDSPYARAAGYASDGIAASMVKSVRVAADTAANLARGAGTVAKAKIGTRVAETTGGQIAGAIQAHGQDTGGAGPTFGENSLAAANSREADPESEVAAFRDRGKRTDNTAYKEEHDEA